MKTLIKLPFKLMILPVILVLGLAIILAKIVTELSLWFFGPAMFLGAGLTIYCAFDYGLTGVILMGTITCLCVIIPLAAYLLIDAVEALNGRFIRFLLG